jgi:hypothetical protein
LSSKNLFRRCEILQAGHHLLAGFEHDRKCALSGAFMEKLVLHLMIRKTDTIGLR